MGDLSARDLERANLVFDVYDFVGTSTIDAVNLGDALRALNLNPTLATIEKLGGTKKKGEKTLKKDEFLAIFKEAKNIKDSGVYEDFIECLKLYDKQENGTMLGAELQHILISLGERLEEKEADIVLKDCLDPEDEDGFIPYVPFLSRMCDRPIPPSTVPR
uniref:Myosin light chain alkali n=1 Tax=Graphocephala atropunctata TaxID=36148 RepID=A0A1B6KHN1_9HEMI